MAVGERSITDVLQDIVRNTQEIVRSEVRLAKTEMAEGVDRAKGASIPLGVGAVCSIFAVLFLLWTVVYALAHVVPIWAATLIVTVLLAVAAAVGISAGLKKLKQVTPKPQRTIESMKENVQWAKQQAK